MVFQKQFKPTRGWGYWSLASTVLFTFLFIASGLSCAAERDTSLEETTILKASSLLGPDLLKSDLYTIDEAVVCDGLLNHYTVRSLFGVYEADSTTALKQLLHEINAIAVMQKIETKTTAVDSVIQSGKNTVDAVANLVMDPSKTLEGAASGVGSLFNRASQVVGKRKTTKAEDSRFEQIIGKTKSKGEIASRYGVSVYSLNPVLQEELERLAWADYLGGIGVGLAQSAIPGAGGLLLTTSGTARILNEIINNTPASELWIRNKKKLEAMGIDNDTAELFVNNPSFSPAHQTVMVDAMERMNGVVNRSLFIKICLQAHTDTMARTIVGIASMLAGYHSNVEPLQSLAPFGRFLYARTQKGTAVVAFPADHVLWSNKVAEAATWLLEPSQGEARPARMQFWILGSFSESARSELQVLGWELHANSRERLLPE